MEPSLQANRIGSREKQHYFNSLSILIKAVEGRKTTIDLRNESSVCGILESTDGFMNVSMKDCIFTDPRGDSFKFETFFITSRNIRYVHIPDEMKIIPAIERQLQKMRFNGKEKQKPTWKSKRAIIRQEETREAVANLKMKE